MMMQNRKVLYIYSETQTQKARCVLFICNHTEWHNMGKIMNSSDKEAMG